MEESGIGWQTWRPTVLCFWLLCSCSSKDLVTGRLDRPYCTWTGWWWWWVGTVWLMSKKVYNNRTIALTYSIRKLTQTIFLKEKQDKLANNFCQWDAYDTKSWRNSCSFFWSAHHLTVMHVGNNFVQYVMSQYQQWLKWVTLLWGLAFDVLVFKNKHNISIRIWYHESVNKQSQKSTYWKPKKKKSHWKQNQHNKFQAKLRESNS